MIWHKINVPILLKTNPFVVFKSSKNVFQRSPYFMNNIGIAINGSSVQNMLHFAIKVRNTTLTIF